MTAIEDRTNHASWVRVSVDGRGFDVAYRDGKPVAVRYAAPGAWWRLETLEPGGAHARAAEAAEEFLAQFRAMGGGA